MPRQRDIYLSPFPLSDEETEKMRPVLVVTGSVHNAAALDVVVMAITSNLGASADGLVIDNENLETGTLPAQSKVLPLKLCSVSQRRLGRFYARFSKDSFEACLEMLKHAIQDSWDAVHSASQFGLLLSSSLRCSRHFTLFQRTGRR